MKTYHRKYVTISIIGILILLNLYWIKNYKQEKKSYESLVKNINVLKLKNDELIGEVQRIIDDKAIDYNILSRYVEFEKINKESLLVFIPPNSCSSCVERLLIKIGSIDKIKQSAFLLSNSTDLFIRNTWKNQINTQLININSPPDIFLSRNKILIIWIDKELQQLKYIWENPLIPEITDVFLSREH